jgi:sugar/nucleoside kinase (ribokinase family)
VISSSAQPASPVYGPPGAPPTVEDGRAADGDVGSRPARPPVADPEAAEPERAAADGPVPTVIVIGAASRDLDPADPRGWRLGGGATYGALVLARLRVRVGVVLGVDAPAAEAHELDLLRDAGADLHLVRLPAGPVFTLEHSPAGRTVRCEDPGGPLPVAALPPAWRAAPAWYLAPVADELPDGWAAIPQGAVVALGWQGLLRDLERGAPARPRPARPRALLRRADLVSVSVEDLDPAADLRALLRLLRTGTICTLTHGALGGVALTIRPGSPRIRHFPALPGGGAVDTTGAGDAFLAALLAARIAPALAGRQPHLPGALKFAAAVAAVHVGGVGLAGVPTLAEVRDAVRRLPPG